jgi:Uncharacterized protein conserved in bacteria (DUF2325)
MALNLPHMLSTSVLQPVPIETRLARSELILKNGTDALDVEPGDPGQAGASAQIARRTRIWEFGSSLHCSIIGTCLTTSELRHILAKLKVDGADAASDHELHAMGVVLAGRREGGAKFLQKALDRRHHAAVTRYARAKDLAALVALWEESLKQGDIPGAYWAALTHPVTSDDVVKRLFGDVHMLSHLVGAANRADIRRLRQMEQENAALAAKVERQQRQLQEGFIARDDTIRRLNDMLARRAGEPPAASDARDSQDEALGADALARDLNRRLAHETARRERGEQRLDELSAALKEMDRALQATRRECRSALQELQTIEGHLAAVIQPESGEALDLSSVTILYVGGRANQVPQLKGLSERVGARFLHHDGGIEHSAGLLPGLVSRADHVFFPIDCISHDAATTIKKLCRQTGKIYQPLRTASLACLLSALGTLRESRERVAAE